MNEILGVEVPRKFVPLLKPSRYKGLHGGRGGAKSHFFAEQLILRCYTRETRAVCIREVQNSLKESVRQLLIDKISKLGLQDRFMVLETEIRGPHGSLIIFRGMQSYNADTIKSLEGYDVAWVEEAQSLSDFSLRLLRPTIRKEGSEIWFSWNPRHDTDAVDVFLRGQTKPTDAVVIEVNWYDNPWFPQVLRDEKDLDYQTDEEMAEHTWGGGYQIISEGSYYARQLAQAERDGRVGFYPYKAGQRVKTAWDLGLDDYTALWFIVDDGFKATVVDYYEASGDGFDDVIGTMMPELFRPPSGPKWFGWSKNKALEAISREIPFQYDVHFLPHDVKVREQAIGGRHRYEVIQGLGVTPLKKGTANGPEERIGAVRALLPSVRFHKCPRVELGIKRLRRYSRKHNDALGTYTTPLHDENSHGADAFGEYAVNNRIEPALIKPPKPPTELVLEAQPGGRITSNMSVMDIIRMKRKSKEAD